MTRRITNADLHDRIRTINELSGTPLEPYSRDEESKRIVHNAGCYHLSLAYGGAALHQIDPVSGSGVLDVFRVGHVPKRDLLARLDAFIAGILAERDRANSPTATD